MTLLDWFHHHLLHEGVAPTELPPPSGCKYALSYDPLNDSEPIEGSAFKEIVNNSDGTFAFKTHDGKFLSQEPMQRGVLKLAPEIKDYEKWGMVGNIVTSWTRPSAGDPIYSYVLIQLPNAA